MAKATWVIPQQEWMTQCGTEAVGKGGRAGTASGSLLQPGAQPNVLEEEGSSLSSWTMHGWLSQTGSLFVSKNGFSTGKRGPIQERW